ncbi:unnamed protein product [Rotaria sordida]|uniref:F-box domain-containing protein n=1 Tax=Rotaria sordida TaxID=392033 RepID=A0A819QCK7_9BILA|nr:unnamed protein product [Rotaria sordida]CAF4033031.1 unnamed protein product [Rotaria sordida]
MTTDKTERSPPNVTWKHSWPLDEIQNALVESDFKAVPTEVILHIFKFLPVPDLCNVSWVCRSFKMVVDLDDIWKLKCKSSAKLHSKSFKQIYMDWMYEKYLRNIELEAVEALYRERSSHYACGLRCGPPQYPTRPAGKHHFVPIGDFKQHPNESETMSIELSVDVEKTARELISLLKKASPFQTEWRQSSIIKQMITRYYRFMQLKASCPNNILLIPTLDIEIIWQTHILRPEMYREDCMRLFHRVIDHSLLATEIEQFLKEQAFIDTCKLYEERFGEQYCPLPKIEDNMKTVPKYVHPIFGKLKCVIPIYSYWDETHYTFSSESSTKFGENPFSFTEADIILDGNWLDLCKKFMKSMLSNVPISSYYRESDEIDIGVSAIKRLKKSYERFLYMATKYPPSNGYTFIHPTYAIDIIWHSHMQEPLKYASDCIRLVGYVIDHSPWPSVDENKMKSSCNDTINAWKKEFESDMSTDHLYNTIQDTFDYWND